MKDCRFTISVVLKDIEMHLIFCSVFILLLSNVMLQLHFISSYILYVAKLQNLLYFQHPSATLPSIESEITFLEFEEKIVFKANISYNIFKTFFQKMFQCLFWIHVLCFPHLFFSKFFFIFMICTSILSCIFQHNILHLYPYQIS